MTWDLVVRDEAGAVLARIGRSVEAKTRRACAICRLRARLRRVFR